MDLFEMSSGQRMHTRYIQVGGVMEDIPRSFEAKLRKFLKAMPIRADQYADLLERNQIFLERRRGRAASPTCRRYRRWSAAATSPI